MDATVILSTGQVINLSGVDLDMDLHFNQAKGECNLYFSGVKEMATQTKASKSAELSFQTLHPDVVVPSYGSDEAAAFDICAHLEEEVESLEPGEIRLIRTGLILGFPKGNAVYIYPRSGNALKRGLSLANGVGVIDSDYRGELGVIMINLSSTTQVIRNGERIAQGVLRSSTRPQLVKTESVEALHGSTTRGQGGFGSTGS